MKELKDAIKVVQAYGIAVKQAVEKTIDFLPLVTRQHIASEAKKKLDSSYAQYMDSITSEIKGDVLIVEMDSENWLANAVESGGDPFDMKNQLNTRKNVKVGKSGYRYAVVPMGKDPHSKGGGTEKSQMYQKAIQTALKKPSFSPSTFRMMNSGKIAEVQQVYSADPLLRGFYRTRIYDDTKEIQGSKKKWNFVMFRIMSENPASTSKWEHPGIKPAFIFKETERWLNNNVEDMFNEFLEEELNILLGK